MLQYPGVKRKWTCPHNYRKFQNNDSGTPGARPYGPVQMRMNANENGKHRYININSIHDNRNMNKMLSSVFQVQ